MVYAADTGVNMPTTCIIRVDAKHYALKYRSMHHNGCQYQDDSTVDADCTGSGIRHPVVWLVIPAPMTLVVWSVLAVLVVVVVLCV